MKKMTNIFIAILLLVGLVGCSADASEESTKKQEAITTAEKVKAEIKDIFKGYKIYDEQVLDNQDGTELYQFYIEKGDEYDMVDVIIGKKTDEIKSIGYSGSVEDAPLKMFGQLVENMGLSNTFIEDIEAGNTSKDVVVEAEEYEEGYGYLTVMPKEKRLQDQYNQDELISNIVNDIKAEGIELEQAEIEDEGYSRTYNFYMPYDMVDDWDMKEDYMFTITIGSNGEGIVQAWAGTYTTIDGDKQFRELKIIGDVLLKYIGTEEQLEQWNKEYNAFEHVSIDLFENNDLSIGTSVYQGGGVADISID